MKTVVWGTGVRAREIVWQIGIESIDFFIDNNVRYDTFFEKPVVSPQEIINWKELYIHIPSSYFKEIIPILKKNGLVENVNYIENLGFIEPDYLYAEQILRYGIDRVTTLAKRTGVKKICNWGNFWNVEGWGVFYANLVNRYRDEIVVVIESCSMTSKEINDYIQADALSVPSIGYGKVKVRNLPDDALDEMIKAIQKDIPKKVLTELAESIYLRKPSIGKKSSLYNACAIYKFMVSMLEAFNFELMIINGSDAPERMFLAQICQKRGIKFICTHPSVLPGTISFDPGGDMGSSMPAVHYEAFRSLPVYDQDKTKAIKVLDELRNNRLNRYRQLRNEAIEIIKKKLIPGRPTVFCAAQCDDGACLIPYTENSRTYHSPMFKSSIESAVFLASICKRRNWNIIYKSHPLYAKFDRVDLLPNNVIYVDACDINDIIDLSDVVTTIRSSTNYVALIRQRPVLMLGYTQTRGQGCTYEAFEREAVELELEKALSEGFTQAQQEAFIEHVARLLKYYLYDDTLPRGLRYGLPMPDDFDSFFELGKRLSKMDDTRG